MKICHMTSVHAQEDIRIFKKECVSLAKTGYEVYQVSRGESGIKEGVRLIGTGPEQPGRFYRLINLARTVYRAAKEVDADVYHFHDPELLPYGLKLKRAGKKVIFDSHEDVSAQILDKQWIPKPFRKLVSTLYRRYESHAVKRLDAVVAATPHIAESFMGRCKKVVVVNNYPKLDDIQFHDKPFAVREPIICYAGAINELRGEKIMIETMKDVEGQLFIAGKHEVKEMQGGRVRFIGQLDRSGVNALYGQAIVGLCILKPIENYYYSKPIKVYEYMAAGLPYICSDFPEWRKVAEESGAGICVDPGDVAQISQKITMLIQDRDCAQTMGRKGREYIVQHCNWTNEEKNLLALYKAMGVQ